MTVVGLSNIAARLGVSPRTAKRLAKTGDLSTRLVDRRRIASRQVIENFRLDREALSSWEGEGGALRCQMPDQPFPHHQRSPQ
ncbi:hypothetical protein MU852_07915 [Brevundimonas albigilva]|uniref:Helix-turn-helix domain-containing protein n=1 Tax=Brevundimonas albigilva TaxID=1312364 RepID=A0ABY4SK28_9CAUL|nr:hypothetical protein [Brevundimonas albigilva]UQV19646.1 hypothetical protein MU852_07915 [Brevundimonas albigilva]URI15327.1 hypothetical protein M8231_16305 [Brevundimonas albigilva]